MGRIVESAILALVALIAILLLGRPLVGKLGVALAPPPALAGVARALPGGIAADAALPAGAATGALPGAPGTAAIPGADASAQEDRMVNVARVEGPVRASALQALAELVDQNPEQSATVLRRWLAPEDED
jgi:flagellar M-ring protein FliF